ncbi:hypothetical protein ACRFNZ_28660, partial [Klebsiella quasipneumoniae]
MNDITELAQSLKAAAIDAKELAIIARYSKGRAAADKFYALANPNNVIALVEAVEKARQHIARQEQILLNQDESLSIRRGELEAAHQRIAELESRAVTDWIEHDGKWRPESLGLDELVYLKTRKQELKIPYPAGKVKGWMNTGG